MGFQSSSSARQRRSAAISESRAWKRHFLDDGTRQFAVCLTSTVDRMGKFPLSRDPFPPVTLSAEQQDALEALAEQQLAMAEAQLDRHILDNSVVDRRRWKPLKTRGRISLFRERSSAAFHRHCHSRSQFQPSTSAVLGTQNDDDWPLPQLLGAGTLEGTLEDVMYGIHAPTAVHVIAKAVISEDEVVDAAVLQELKGPTIAHPFRFLGLKWLVKAHPVAMGALVLPRDIVYVEHAGIKTRADGSKLGHFLIHSAELPQFPELRRELGLVRARVSSCVLLRQNTDDLNKVDVFMTGRVAAHGRVLDSLALLSTANGLTYFWKAGVSAQRRKLAWRLQHKRKALPPATSVPPSKCPLCIKGIDHAFRSPTRCEMCGIRMCWRCCVTQKLLFPGSFGNKETHLVAVELCTPCITQTTGESAMAIARQEIRAGQYGALTSPRGARRRPSRLTVKPHDAKFSASAGPPLTRNQLESNPRKEHAFAASAESSEPKLASNEAMARESLQRMNHFLHSTHRLDGWEDSLRERRKEFTRSQDEEANLLTPGQKPMRIEDLAKAR